MSSGADISSDTRTFRDNLTRFAYRPEQKSLPAPQQVAGLPTTPPRSPGMSYNPPAQSRDATNSSRFFVANPANGTVLVPSSSPLSKESNDQPYRPYQYSVGGRTMGGSSQQGSKGQSLKNHADLLSRPSGFVASTGVNNAPITRQSPPAIRRPIDFDDGNNEERPRKRVHLDSPVPESVDVATPGSPPSPEILRPGQRRRFMTNNSLAPSSSRSSDEASTDGRVSVSGSPRARIVRAAQTEDKVLPLLIMEHPLVPPRVVEAVYNSVGKDRGRTDKVLTDSNFDRSKYEPSSTITALQSVSTVGKVRELEEEREALRAQQKQIASKSSIYKRRVINDSPPPSSSSLPTSPVSGLPETSPIRSKPSRLKTRRHVVDSESDNESEGPGEIFQNRFEKQTLESFNTFELDALRELTGCTQEQVEKIMSLRPFESVADLRKRLGQDKKRAGPAGISPRLFEDCVEICEGYGNVDMILKECEQIGRELKKAIDCWSGQEKGKEEASIPSLKDVSDDGALNLISLSESASQHGLLTQPPSLLASDVELKNYQLTGVSWLRLLHSKGYSCILADEMGLGKTIQVISFFAYLKEHGCAGPHLVVVPSSTLENWCREFERFAPSIAIETYYGHKNDRPVLRDSLLRTRPGKDKKGKSWDVLITTYQLAVGDKLDKKFFRKISWNTCVFDEGHVLKNFQSQRYTTLTRIGAKWKLLLTGTPLQNNLQELVSVMGFILPDKFGDEEVSANLRAIFKVKGDTKLLLAEERIKRAKAMMTPFVLRRRKDQVLKELPKKTERIEWCTLTPLQTSIYRDACRRTRKPIIEAAASLGTSNDASKDTVSETRKKDKWKSREADRKQDNATNALMELRKAALHPMLFRTHFAEESLQTVARALLKEPDFKRRGALFDIVMEDMGPMTDAEMQTMCRMYKSTQKFLLGDDCYIDSGKVQVMLKLLERYMEEGRKVLIFSQFTQMIDILEVILKQRSIEFLTLTGNTAVDVRQGLVDKFTEDESIPVFLLSTKAGGMGINLTAASVVILFDQDFNPHNDRQAADRAYRIGQTRDVDVIKLISRGTVEEDMFRLGQTKLALDEAVAGEADESYDGTEVGKMIKTSLMQKLRRQFEAEDTGTPAEASINGADEPKKTERETSANEAATAGEERQTSSTNGKGTHKGQMRKNDESKKKNEEVKSNVGTKKSYETKSGNGTEKSDKEEKKITRGTKKVNEERKKKNEERKKTATALVELDSDLSDLTDLEDS